MDDGKGNFQEITESVFERLNREHPTETQVFKVGEEVTVKGSRFKVQEIRPHQLVLNLLPHKDHDPFQLKQYELKKLY